MPDFVIDASVTMSWCFEDEITDATDRLLDQLRTGSSALVPMIWPLEVANVLLVAERRNRTTEARIDQFLDLLTGLPIEVQTAPTRHVLHEVRLLAKAHHLSAYDAAYLHLSLQEELPLASLDQRLRRAASDLGIAIRE